MTFIAIAFARFESSCPILPNPAIPSVLPLTSIPMNCERFHSPFLTEAVACGIFLTRDIIMATVCSHAARVLPAGAFATIIPRFVAGSISILSTPAPARPMNFSLSAASMILAVT